MVKKIINFDMLRKRHKKHKPNWPQIADYPYRILLIGGSGPRKKNHYSI